MKYLILILALISFSFTESKHIGKSGVKVLNATTQQIFGRNVGYYLTFKNCNTSKSVDGLKWNAIFTNNFGENMGTREGEWQSGNLITPIKPDEKMEDIEGVWVKGATKVKIVITQVHFE